MGSKPRVAFAQRSAAERSRAFLGLLIGILLVYALIVTAGDQSFASPLRLALLGAALVVDLRVRGRPRREQVAVAVLVLVACTATIVAAAAGSELVITAVQGGTTLVLVVIAIRSIIRTLVRAQVVDLAAVLGVLDVYLLLVLLFASAHQLFSAMQTGYLSGVVGLPSASDDLYFSAITLTTVGYGDITPGTELARTVAITEALVGQLYLVSIVAGVVSGWRRRPPSDSEEPDGGDGAG